MRSLLLLIILAGSQIMSNSLIAQEAEVSILFLQQPDDDDPKKEFPEFRAKELILPGAAIGYGLLALNNSTLIDWNESIKESLGGDQEVGFDNIGLYIPVALAYGLDLFTHDSKHNFKDRTIVLLTATAINNGVSFGLKSITNEKRPAEEKYNSFPSAHTSNAFVAAEFLRQEFKDESPLYGILGYGMGATIGYLRIYNNKHWFSDVVAGAAVGVLSTKTAYWIYPWMDEKIFHNERGSLDFSLYPGYTDGAPQVGLLVNF